MPTEPELQPLPHLDAEEAYLLLADVLTEVAAGRPDGHVCPHCGEGSLRCTLDPDRDRLEVSCPKCRLYFAGVLAGGYS